MKTIHTYHNLREALTIVTLSIADDIIPHVQDVEDILQDWDSVPKDVPFYEINIGIIDLQKDK